MKLNKIDKSDYILCTGLFDDHHDDLKYYKKAYMLSRAFIKNFKKFSDYASDQIILGAPNERN